MISIASSCTDTTFCSMPTSNRQYSLLLNLLSEKHLNCNTFSVFSNNCVTLNADVAFSPNVI